MRRMSPTGRWSVYLVCAAALAPFSSSSADDADRAAGQVGPYEPSALYPIAKESVDQGNWPQWRRAMEPWQWARVAGSDLAAVKPPNKVPGRLSARIDAWNGLAADRRSNRLFIAGNGGHADYSGNEAYVIDLSVDEPRWRMLRPPTAREHIVPSNASKMIFHDYYLDGRPSSTHTYYALNFLGSRNAIFKFGAGSLWGSGNEKNWKTDAFSLESNDWQPAESWPDVVADSRKGALAASICMDPGNEQVYIAAPRLRRFDPKTGEFEVLARWPMNATSVYARGCAVDPVRKRVVFFGDAYRSPHGGLIYDITTGELEQIEFTGQDVPAITKKDHNFAWYEPRLDKFLLKTRTGGRVYAIDPVSFESELLATTGAEDMPDAHAGVHTRWQRLPRLGGYAYYPRHGSGIWFLAID